MPESAGVAARAAALDALQAVLRDGRRLDDALAASRGIAGLAPRDRAWCRALVAASLRRLGETDAVLGRCLRHPLAPELAATHDILRLLATQILFLGTPHHAAVDTAVALARMRRHGRLAGLVNAVGRRLARESPAPLSGSAAAVANTPAWLLAGWQEEFGRDTACAIAAAHLAEPPLDITLAPGRDAAEWARRLDASVLPTGTLRRATARVAELPGYGDGAWWVQDAAAALPARLAGDVAGRRVIDLCAAPGGKTAQLAAAGARVTAVDRSPARLARLQQNLDRLGLDAETVAADAVDLAGWPAGRSAGRSTGRLVPADVVLLDAPCTATGILRRHPDVAHLRKPGDLADCVALQRRLLDAAVGLVAPGGLLIYAVCSLQPEEGREQAEALLARHPGLVRTPVTAREAGGLDAVVTPEGDLRTLPCHLAERGGMDGFYAARLRVPPAAQRPITDEIGPSCP